MRLKILTVIALASLTVSCGGADKSTSQEKGQENSSTQSTLDREQNEEPLSSIENPFELRQEFNTSGWSGMRVDLLGKVSERVAQIYTTEYDPSLDYLMVEFSGVNKNGKKTNMYATMHACVPGGAVGKSGIFRQLMIGSRYENESSGLNLITTGDDEVLDGFKSTGVALYPIERGDSSAFIMSQSHHCGNEHDLVVSLGNTSTLPVIP